ncbi:hypothetical protein ACJX0J_027476, partial [Zea mays]
MFWQKDFSEENFDFLTLGTQTVLGPLALETRTLGTQTQTPFCIVIGWIMGQKMNLYFQLFETTTLFITVLAVAFMLQVEFGLASQCTSDLLELQGLLLPTALLVLASISSIETRETH